MSKSYTFQEYEKMFTIDLADNIPLKAGKVLLAIKPGLGENCPCYNTIQKFFRVEKYKYLDMETYDRLTENEISLFKADKILAEKRKMILIIK